MTKTELINSISTAANISRTDASRSLESILQAIMVTLKKGDKVMLVDFGTFYVAERKSRVVPNPGVMGGPALPVKKVAKFTSGLTL